MLAIEMLAIEGYVQCEYNRIKADLYWMNKKRSSFYSNPALNQGP